MYEKSKSPTALPVYLQISEVLIREIAAGRLLQGQRLPPERELAKQHGTTVRTLRKALDILKDNGMLDRVQGSGNYVKSNPDVESVYSMFRLELRDGGGLPKAQVLSIDEMAKPDDLPDFGTSDRATRIRRLRYLDRTPVAIEEIWLDLDAGRVDPAHLSDSLYRYYKMRLGFWITDAEDRVSTSEVPGWTVEAFAPETGETVGFIERLSRSERLGAVEYSRTWFDAAKACYVQRFR